ncbi:MAG TPA: AAA domain-containing protein [Pseudolysinimonas sp.]|nr:AAA domain-containing protein [Pseudolysinimonas sp.]
MTFESSALLQRASKEWRSSLIDVSGNNRLLYFRPTASTINLDASPSSAVRRLLAGDVVKLTDLVPDPAKLRVAQRACAGLARKQREAREEYGVSVAFLAVGLATWDPNASTALAKAQAAEVATEEGARPSYTHPSAPVLLRPLELTMRRGTQEAWELKLEEDFQFNGVLEHVLHAANVDLDDDEILQYDDGSADGVSEMLDLVEAACDGIPSFELDRTFVLGAFSYQKQPMVADVDNLSALGGSDLVAALAGDSEAAGRVRSTASEISVELAQPDWQPVDSEYLVLDADSSQSYVVNAALAGRNLVVQGPPGTGKSQTIANIIATMIASGRTVLFVAQKRAAIAAVLDRLNGVDLEHLVLDMFASTGSRRFVAEELRNVLDRQKTTGVPNVDDLHFRLATARDRLVQHTQEMNKGRGWGVDPDVAGSGVNVTWLRAEAAGLPAGARTTLRLPIAVFAAWHKSALTEHARALDELEVLGALQPEWRAAAGWSPDALTTSDLVVEQGERARTLSQFGIPSLRRLLAPLAAAAGAETATTWAEVDVLFALYRDVRTVASTTPALLAEVPDELLDDMLYVTARHRRASGRKVAWGSRRAAGRAIKRHLPGRKRDQAHHDLQLAASVRQRWRGVDRPSVPDELPAVEAAAAAAAADLAAVQAAVQNLALRDLALDECVVALAQLAAQENRGRLPVARSYELQLADAGLQPVVDALREQIASGHPLKAGAGDVLRWVAVRSVLEHAEATSPALSMANGPELNRAVREFQAAEAAKLGANAARVRRLAAEHFRATLDAYANEHSVLRAEVTRKRNFRAVRTLFREAPHVMLAAKPIWAMSPLQVSRLMPARKCFDVVIFDEASQVKPADAIPSLLRAGQAIVAGDSHQLPPTDFFTKVLEDDGSDDGEEEAAGLGEAPASEGDDQAPGRRGSATRDQESILAAMDTVLSGQSRMLQWHYRSRDDRLIAVSNVGVYSGALTTFPSADAPDALRHVTVPPSAGINKTDNSPQGEVARVVELVREHIGEHPDESLGVITFGIKHQNRIEQALEAAAREDAALRSALSGGAKEPFFVKSIERVQGDERDAIILSVGYGKGLDGKLRYLWGPLLQEGGDRRLNVAISRARRRMTLVTSFTADDVADDAHPSAGFRLMCRFLRYMASNGDDLHSGPQRDVELNPFEIDVRDRLTAAGLELDPQVGAGEYRIDFAVRHPQYPGRHVLAIEADGANYHGTPTARERDRLRQMLLEARGWKFYRIWSTDWFNNPEREIANVLAAYHDALAQSDSSAGDDTVGAEMDESWHVTEAAPRIPKPRLYPGLPITEYPHRVLVSLIEHYRSDGVLRTADEELALAMQDLGFQKRGSRIVAALEAAIRAARRA